MLDGASNDEGWGRQTMLTTVPLGAVQEVAVLTNAFSAEFGWTAGPALNIVTKSGTNALHGEALYLGRPGGWQAKTFSTEGLLPAVGRRPARRPARSSAINPADLPDELNQVSGSIGGPIVKDKTFFFATADYTRQDRTTFLSSTLPAFVLPADGSLDVRRPLPPEAGQRPARSQAHAGQTLMVRGQLRSLLRHQPERRGGRHQRADRGAPLHARLAGGRRSTTRPSLSPNLLNEARVAYLDGDPVTLWEAQKLSTTYTRAGSVPFTIGESRASDIFGHQVQFADTLSWSRGTHNLRFGGSVVHHTPAAPAASRGRPCSAPSRSSPRRRRRSSS